MKRGKKTPLGNWALLLFRPFVPHNEVGHSEEDPCHTAKENQKNEV